MPDYKEIYLKLFRAHVKAIAMLMEASIEAEELAMGFDEPRTAAEKGSLTQELGGKV